MRLEQIMQAFYKKSLCVLYVALCALCLVGTNWAIASNEDGLGSSSGSVMDSPQRSIRPDAVPKDSQATTAHWQKARAYQRAGRYELSRQEYLHALAHCRTSETRDRLERELQIIDMQLRTLR